MGKVKANVVALAKKNLTTSKATHYNQRTQRSERLRDTRNSYLFTQAQIDRYIDDMIRRGLY